MQALKSQIVGRYALQKKLAHKADRQTFIAKDLETHTPVIVKILQFGGAFSWDTLKLFKREAQILQQLNHPAISQYKDSFETEIEGVHSFVLVQSYIAAPSLETLVEQGKQFSQADVIEIAQQLLETLKYLHQQLPPVIHRDIKPSNILLSLRPNGTPHQVTLVDFGSVQVSATKYSGTMTIVGSYGYMPLEQFSGQTTPASDLYSLGMTLMYLLTGTHPAEMPQMDGHIQIASLLAHKPVSDYVCHWLGQLTHPYVDVRLNSAAIALTLLKSQDGTRGYYPHLRPPHTALHICRHRDELKIITKLKSHKSYSYTGCLLFPLFMACAALLTIIAGPLALMTFGPLLFVVFQVWETWQSADYYTVLSIHPQRGIRRGIAKGDSPSQLSRIKWNRRTSPFEAINLVTYIPGHTFDKYYIGSKNYSHIWTHNGQRNLATTSGIIHIPPQISIHAGKREYAVPYQLSDAEQLWLDHEFNNFLGLSLQTLDPTDEATRKSS